jgi:hypothetical protein
MTPFHVSEVGRQSLGGSWQEAFLEGDRGFVVQGEEASALLGAVTALQLRTGEWEPQ